MEKKTITIIYPENVNNGRTNVSIVYDSYGDYSLDVGLLCSGISAIASHLMQRASSLDKRTEIATFITMRQLFNEIEKDALDDMNKNVVPSGAAYAVSKDVDELKRQLSEMRGGE